MRSKLQKFTEFANALFPHETSFLLSIQQFEDEAKLAILQRIDHNSHQQRQRIPYNTQIDKRKYSNLKQWIQDRLRAADVDEYFDWLVGMEQKLARDLIAQEEERQLLRALREHASPGFYFVKFYELMRMYRHYLLIRMRYRHHAQVDRFLQDWQAVYDRCRATHERLHEATKDIVGQYSQGEAQSLQWESWLTEVFYDDRMDGLNRYMALVRLTFIYFNYRQFEKLRDKFDYIDSLFRSGKYYSRRLLLNYYGNRVLLHTKFREYDKAEYYGYLSIRDKNSDYIMYVNNLSAVLLRERKYEAALQVMRAAYPEMKATANMHNRIGFVAFYLKCLNANAQYDQAERYAGNFLRAYKEEVFAYRWHIFFSAYLEALLKQEKFSKLIRVVRKHQLLQREKEYQANANYLPTLQWYNAIAKYKEMALGQEDLYHIISSSLQNLPGGPESKKFQLQDLMHEVRDFIPAVLNRVQEEMGTRR